MAKILYVEDDEMNRDMLSRRLQRRNYEILLAFDGQEGLDKMRSEKPDLVLMDMGLPVIDGWEATTMAKADEEIKSIFENKPDNQFTQPKPQSLLNRVSSFFAKDKTSDIKLDPNLKLQKDLIAEKELNEINQESNFDFDNQKSQKNQINETFFS